MVTESELLSAIGQMYPNGVCMDDPNVIRGLSKNLGEELSDIVVRRAKRKMFTNSAGYSFTLDLVANEEVLNEIRLSVCEFVTCYGRYQSEAFFELYRYRINESIINDAETFQELLESLVPSDITDARMKRLKTGPFTEVLVLHLEAIVEENSGCMDLDELAIQVPGFTRETIVKCFSKFSNSYHVVNDDGYLYVERLSEVPSELFDSVTEVTTKLQEMDVLCTDDVINAVLSMRFGYNVFKRYGALSDWKRRMSVDKTE